jgi:hypothetical protein
VRTLADRASWVFGPELIHLATDAVAVRIEVVRIRLANLKAAERDVLAIKVRRWRFDAHARVRRITTATRVAASAACTASTASRGGLLLIRPQVGARGCHDGQEQHAEQSQAESLVLTYRRPTQRAPQAE